MDSPNVTPKKRLPNTPKKRKRVDTITEKSLKYFKKVSGQDLLKDPSKTHFCDICGKRYNGSNEWNLTSHLQKFHPSVYDEIVGKK